MIMIYILYFNQLVNINQATSFVPVPSGTILLANPNWRASWADISLPVRIRSRARDKPISLGSRIVPPSRRGTPGKRNGRQTHERIMRKSDIMVLFYSWGRGGGGWLNGE